MQQIQLIINKPQALNLQNKITSVSITFVFWIVLFYLWQPLISLIAWSFGFKVFYEHMIILGGFEGFLEMLTLYVVIISILGGTLISWALYNRFRFKNKTKRGVVDCVSPQDMADFFKVDANLQMKWKKEKNLTVFITEENAITVKKNTINFVS